MRGTLLVTALVVVAGAAAAQQTPAPAATAQTRPAWMGPGLVEYLATNPADLNLTRDQQNRVRQAREQLDRANTPLHQRLATARANQAWGNLTVDQRRALVDSARQLHEQIRSNQLTARDAVNQTLTAEQKNTLEGRRQWMGGGRMGHRMMHRGMIGPGARPWMRRGMGMGPGMGWGRRMPMMAPGARLDAWGPRARRWRLE